MNTLLKGALLGAGTALAVVLLSSFQSTISQMLRVVVTNPVELKTVDTNPVGSFLHPRNSVRIREGTPFTVPVGKLIVLTSMGSIEVSSAVQNTVLTIDGVDEAVVRYSTTQMSTATSTVTPLPEGLVAGEGQVVAVAELDPTDEAGVAWGFLVDA